MGRNGTQSITRMRLERLVDERERLGERMEDALKIAEEDKRGLNEFEEQQFAHWRDDIASMDGEIELLTADVERETKSRDVSAVLRAADDGKPAELEASGGVVYRTFAQYARDKLIVDFPLLASAASRPNGDVQTVREQARERLQRVENTLTSDIAGLLPPQHLAQIMDIVNRTRPVVASGRQVPLDRGQLTYPKITGRPEVLVQSAEKTEAGTAKMSVELETLNADTYLGAGDLSWQAINWSTPDALQLWFDLAAEAYAQQTETAACTELLGTAGGGTISVPLGTAGTEDFATWRGAAIAAIASIYTGTAGRAQTDTLYLAAARFFQLAGLGTDQTLQVSNVGNLDIGSMTGTWAGLKVVGSYGFTNPNAAIVGDASALLVGETPGAPIEMRAVEPAIGGMEVGVIGAFKAQVFDSNRFMHLS